MANEEDSSETTGSGKEVVSDYFGNDIEVSYRLTSVPYFWPPDLSYTEAARPHAGESWRDSSTCRPP